MPYYYGYPYYGYGYYNYGSQQNHQQLNTRLVEFKAIGKGIAPLNATSKGQAILLAERAAIMDGYRKLAEAVNGVYIDYYSQMTNGAVDFDYIRTETEGLLTGAEIMNTEHDNNGIASVYMQIRLRVGPNHPLYRYGRSMEAMP